jgi:PucR C-terminal helix-turn-helix domain
VYVSTDVFADALRAPSPAASSCDLVLTIDDGGIAEVARDYGGNPALRNPARAAQARLDASPVLGLIHAVANSDAGSFATAAAALTRAAVMVLDGDGALIASSDKPGPGRRDVSSEPAGDSRDILLHDESGLWGAVRLINTPSVTAGTEGMLRDLGLTLVKSIRADRQRATLESQLIVLSCLAGEDAERLFRRDGEAYSGIARRLVVVRAATAIAGHAGARLKDALVRAAGCTECLRGLCVVVSQGALIGVYRDTGLSLSRQRRAWAEVIDAVSAGWRLTVAVGAAVSESEDFPVQHRLVREIAKIQQSRCRYFDLPGVAMLDDLGPLAEVLGTTPGRELVPFVERILGGLLYDQRFGGQLIETLYAYLQTNGSPREAGALLHLHPSTVKYRIRVIRELLGPRLEDQSTRFDLELAVRLCLAANLLRKGRRQT